MSSYVLPFVCWRTNIRATIIFFFVYIRLVKKDLFFSLVDTSQFSIFCYEFTTCDKTRSTETLLADFLCNLSMERLDIATAFFTNWTWLAAALLLLWSWSQTSNVCCWTAPIALLSASSTAYTASTPSTPRSPKST